MSIDHPHLWADVCSQKLTEVFGCFTDSSDVLSCPFNPVRAHHISRNNDKYHVVDLACVVIEALLDDDMRMVVVRPRPHSVTDARDEFQKVVAVLCNDIEMLKRIRVAHRHTCEQLRVIRLAERRVRSFSGYTSPGGITDVQGVTLVSLFLVAQKHLQPSDLGGGVWRFSIPRSSPSTAAHRRWSQG